MLTDNAPPHRTVQYSPDGFYFHKTADIHEPISDPGVCREEGTVESEYSQGVSWGLSQLYEGHNVYLVRWDCPMTVRKF